MSETRTPLREEVIADGPIDWQEHEPSNSVGFREGDANEYNPVHVDGIRQLHNNGEEISTPIGQDLDDLLSWGDRIHEATDGEAHIAFTGFLTGPDHRDHPLIHVDGLVAVPGDADAFPTELQLEFIKEYRLADTVVVEDDLLKVWWD